MGEYSLTLIFLSYIFAFLLLLILYALLDKVPSLYGINFPYLKRKTEGAGLEQFISKLFL